MSAIEDFGSPLAAPIRRLASDANAAAIVVALNATLASMKAAGVMAPDLTYAETVRLLGGTGHWAFDEASGTVAAAYLGANGAYVNAPTLGATGLLVGGSGKAVTLGGTKKITVPVATTAGDHSFAMLVKPSALPVCLFASADYNVTIDATHYMHIYTGVAATESYSNTALTTALANGTTAHIIVTRLNNGVYGVYVNGAAFAFSNVAGTQVPSTSIDVGWKAAMSCAGTVDEFSFFGGHIVTAAEALLLYNVSAGV